MKEMSRARTTPPDPSRAPTGTSERELTNSELRRVNSELRREIRELEASLTKSRQIIAQMRGSAWKLLPWRGFAS